MYDRYGKPVQTKLIAKKKGNKPKVYVGVGPDGVTRDGMKMAWDTLISIPKRCVAAAACPPPLSRHRRSQTHSMIHCADCVAATCCVTCGCAVAGDRWMGGAFTINMFIRTPRRKDKRQCFHPCFQINNVTGELQQYSCTRKVWANTGLNIDRAPRASPALT